MNEPMETSLNITDYPEPKEQKCFEFNCECSCKGTITIYADNEEEARKRLNNSDYDYESYYLFEIENVEGVKEE